MEMITSGFLSVLVFFFLNFFGQDFYGLFILIDEFSMMMLCLSIFLSLCVSWVIMNNIQKQTLNLIATFSVSGFFLTDSPFWFFLFFEISLIPLVFLIMGWGRQPERLNASFFLSLFTIFFSVPLFLGVVFLKANTLTFSLLLFHSSDLFPLVFFAFFVKIPVFFFHSWLPKAHVEAPLEGSMILAGVMLKLGVFGFYRFFCFASLEEELLDFFYCLGLFGSLFSLLIALSSDDVKMAVAFSSVSHMNFVFTFLVTGKIVAAKGALMIMISHGLSSPLLFYLVTVIYKMAHSRSILLGKGLLSKIPFLSILAFFLWIINLSPPPFLSFLGELLGIFSIFSFFSLSLLWVVSYVFFSSFFSALTFAIYGHSSGKLHFKVVEQNYFFSLVSFLLVSALVFMFFSSILYSLKIGLGDHGSFGTSE